MSYLRYHTQTGEILATLQCDPAHLHLHETEGTALLPGNVTIQQNWISEGEIKPREQLPFSGPVIPFMPGANEIVAFNALPDDCWVRIRGTEEMPFAAIVVQAVDGVVKFVPELVGRYVAQPVGRYEALPVEFEVQPLAIVKDRQQKAVAMKKAEQLASGFIWNGRLWDADANAQTTLSSMANAVSSGMVVPDDFFWTSFDNKDVPLSGQDIKALNAAMMTFVFSTHSYARSLKEQIEAQQTNEAVMGINISVGWPG